MKALVTGTGPLADGAAEVLAALGWQIRRSKTADSAAAPGEQLLVVAPPAEAGPAALEEIFAAPARLAEAMAAQLPDSARDETGELRAPGQAVFLLTRAAQTPGLGDDAGAAQAALLRWMAGAALALAPRLRLNALACDPGISAADLAPLLGWLTSAHAVTGQVVNLGPAPRLAAPWLGAGRQGPAGAGI